MVMLAVPVRGKAKSAMLCDAFLRGAPKSAFGFVFYGVNETNMRDWQIAQKSGHDWFYIDGSYFDKVRGQQFRITKNRIQVEAAKYASDGRRFAALSIEVKPRRKADANRRDVLLVQQSATFMQDVARDPRWFSQTEQTLTAGGYRVRVRRWDRDKILQQTTLPFDLTDAWAVAAHSSAALVTAACEGVPIVAASPMSALYGMACSADPAYDQRQRFLNVLADSQFSISEMKSGEAFAWLSRDR